MLSRYIKNLLKTQNRVIVPDLGAFLQKGDALKTIYFNEFLKFNDELLVNYVSEQEHIDKTDAARMIKNFTLELQCKLQSERTASLDDLGTLYLDKNEKIQLRTNFTFSLIPDSAERLWKKHVRSMTIHETNNSNNRYDYSSYSDADNSKQKEGFETNPAFFASSDSKMKQSDEQKLSNENFKSAFSSKKIVFIFGFFLLLLAIAYFVFLQPAKDNKLLFSPFSDSLKIQLSEKPNGESLYKTEKADQKVSSIKKEMEAHPSGMNDKKEIETKAAPVIEKTGTSPLQNKAEHNIDSAKTISKRTFASSINIADHKFYLIAGSFSQEGNADNLIKKLNAEGFPAEKIVLPEGHFYVSYNSFSSKKLAEMELKRLKSTGVSGTWLFYY